MFFTSKISALSDEKLLALFRETENDDYFTELYSRYIHLTYGVCLNYLKSEADAQDMVMELFEDVRRKALQYDIQFFRGWLYNVVRNRCYKTVQARNNQTFVDLVPEFMESDDFPTLLEEDNKEENFRLLQKCMEQLPHPQKVSIKLFFMSYKSYMEITKITGFHLKSVKSFIQNGKRNLKICMENGIR